MSLHHYPNIVTDGLALCIDPNSNISYSKNVFPYPTDIYEFSKNASTNNCIQTKDSITSPVGNTPLKMTVTGSDPHIGTYNAAPFNVVPAFAGETWTVSFWVKSSEPTTGEVFIFAADSSGTAFVGGNWIGITALEYNVTTEWTRVNHSITITNTNSAFLQVRLDGSTSEYTRPIDIWWDGMQVEKNSSATDFTKISYSNSVRNIVNIPQRLTQNNSLYIDKEPNALRFTRSASTPKLGGSLSINGTNNLTATNFVYNNHSWDVFFKINDRTPGLYDETEGYSLICAYRGYHCGFMYDSSNVYYYLWDGLFNNIETSRISLGTSGTNIIEGQWAHLCATKNAQGVKVYLNGNLVTTYTGTFRINIGVSDDIRFGAAQTNTAIAYTYYSKLSMGQSKMYNKELSASEVKQNFDAVRSRYGI